MAQNHVYSMTSFVTHQTNTEQGCFSWELRSVNHRFLELYFKLPEQFKSLEPQLRTITKQYLQRGKVELSLRYQVAKNMAPNWVVNEAQVTQLIKATQTISQQLDNPAPISALDILMWPNSLQQNNAQMQSIQQQACESFEQGLNKFLLCRINEGEALTKPIVSRLDLITDLLKGLAEKLPQFQQLRQEKILQEIQALDLEAEPNRLEQELFFWATRGDITEELDRAIIHVAESQRTLQTCAGPIGRRLDFLMQELHREINTMASKAIHADVSSTAIALKVAVEQIKEQVQNIE